jgi:hypothetical protein
MMIRASEPPMKPRRLGLLTAGFPRGSDMATSLIESLLMTNAHVAMAQSNACDKRTS